MDSKGVSLAALFVALTAVSAQITIPLGPVPFTLQVFTVLLSGLILGARLGFIGQALYVLAGAVGLPVFAGFAGGFAHIYGPTGGYLMAFPLAAMISGLFSKRSRKLRVIGALAGLGVIYLFGWLRLGLYFGGDFGKAFAVGVAPFMAPDVIKAALAAGVAEKVRKRVDLDP